MPEAKIRPQGSGKVKMYYLYQIGPNLFQTASYPLKDAILVASGNFIDVLKAITQFMQDPKNTIMESYYILKKKACCLEPMGAYTAETPQDAVNKMVQAGMLEGIEFNQTYIVIPEDIYYHHYSPVTPKQ